MKTTDHNVEQLKRHLKEEADALRARAERLDELSAATIVAVRRQSSTAHTFEYVAQEAISIITHRSNVHPESIARTCVSLAAEAAAEWVKAQAVAV